MLNVAYIGFGNSVVRYHLPYVKNRKFIKVKTIYRRPEDRKNKDERKREKLYPEISFTTDLNEIFMDSEINLVVINSPNNTHFEYAKELLNNNKNVLIEKPLAMSSVEAKEIFDLAKSKNLIAMANQNRRFDADFLALKKVIDNNKCGSIVEMESHYDYYKSETKNFVGYLFGLGVHTIDQMISLFGIPNHVVYDVRSIFHPHEADDYFDLDLFYDSYKVVVKTCYSIKSKYPKFQLHGRNGSYIQYDYATHNSEKTYEREPFIVSDTSISKEHWGNLVYMDGDNELSEKIPICNTDYGKIYDGLYESIENGKEKPIKDKETIAVLEIIEEALKEMK